MKKAFSIALIALFLGASVSLGFDVNAQTPPALYDQSGKAVNGFNSSTGALNPGWYYDQSGVRLYYNADGTFYNPSTQLYGGTVLYPHARGFTIAQNTTGTVNTGTTPGVPNTGAGGDALTAWVALVASLIVGAAGLVYLARRRISS